MRAFLVILVGLALSLGMGIGAAWYLRPEPDGPAAGPGFDEDFVAPQVSEEREPVLTQNSTPLAVADEWTLRNNRALEILEAGDMALALAEFRACHQAQPDNMVFLRNLVETMARIARGLWRQGDRLEAIWKLEDAVELAQGLPAADRRDDLSLLLERWRREYEVEFEFWVDMSIHFELSYDARHEDLVRGYQEVLDRAEDAYADLRDFFGFDPVFESKQRMRVILYRRDTFSEVTGLASWAGGAFDGSVRLPVTDLTAELPQMSLLLRHELTHAFIDAAPTHGTVPGWLNEGLAQLLSGERTVVMARAKEVLDPGLAPLADLTGAFSSIQDPPAVTRAYTQALATVDMIRTRYGEALLRDMVALLTTAPTEAEADLTPHERLDAYFEAETGWTLDALLKEHVREW